jgi:ADP-heptose:LPS heptosyltransferase
MARPGFSPHPRKLILRCGLALGDIVMLTAAVRDLHRCYPEQFLTAVRTPFSELWEHNPFITELRDDDPAVEHLDCSYPLINRCDRVPYHCLHGFIEFLNEKLRLSIKPTEFKGHIHLSDQEKAWFSQVLELTKVPIPFWLIAAGGKYDVTIKWWRTERFQQVVDHFHGKILFVQVGQHGHYHPRLNDVIDLRGRTSLRQLIRLVHHAQGVLCPVTSLMHLAAAVETRAGLPKNRACVVIAGGREPAYWEAYPDHQFIHTNGALPCCSAGGCWKDRVIPMRDGDRRDHKDALCVNVLNSLPRCMDLITSAEAIRRVELYFQGGSLRYLRPEHNRASRLAVIASRKNRYDRQTLNLHNAGLACDRFIATMPRFSNRYSGQGIVVCGGGQRYLPGAWVCIKSLRRLGCSLPVELWHLGPSEIDDQMKPSLERLNVRCVDALEVRKQFPSRRLRGWELKPYSVLHSRFRQVLLLDADNVPVIDPGFLFETSQFRRTGAVFWPDYRRVGGDRARIIWHSCGLRLPGEQEFETGQVLVDKQRCWRALRLTMWFNENSDFYYHYVHGDKETFHLAFRKLRQRFALVPHPIHSLEATICQHDFSGRRIFQHRNLDKWDPSLKNKRIEGFLFERECRKDLAELHRLWNGPWPARPVPSSKRPLRQTLRLG